LRCILKFDSSPTQAKSIPVGSLGLRRDQLAICRLFGADRELVVSGWDHAHLDSLNRQPKRLFGARREDGKALTGSHVSPRFIGIGSWGSLEFYVPGLAGQ
jgi:hypothetical protein